MCINLNSLANFEFCREAGDEVAFVEAVHFHEVLVEASVVAAEGTAVGTEVGTGVPGVLAHVRVLVHEDPW